MSPKVNLKYSFYISWEVKLNKFMTFQLNSQTIGLTYPQTKLSYQQLYDGLKTIFSNNCILYMVIATELHLDGGSHYHVGIKLESPFRTRDERFGDIHGEHPNVLRPRNFRHWVAYCKKHGEFKEEGSLSTRTSDPRPTEEEVISRATSDTKLDFLIWAGCNRVTYAEKIWELANKCDGITLTADQTWEGIMKPCLQNFAFSLEWIGPKALILIGESGTGKTTWAKTNIPKPCLFVTHIDELKQFRKGYHVSILFDDVSFKHYPIQAQIHLVDHWDSRTIHIRYGTASIPAKTIKVFTCNEDPVNLQDPAIARRCKVVRVNNQDRFDNNELL